MLLPIIIPWPGTDYSFELAPHMFDSRFWYARVIDSQTNHVWEFLCSGQAVTLGSARRAIQRYAEEEWDYV